MRIVCDTNVLVRAAINPNRLAGELLRQIGASHVLLTSVPMLAELFEVLRRPQMQRLHGLNEEGMRRFVRSLYKAATIVVVPQPIPRVVPHDAKDDAVLLTAIGGKANYLATRDRHFSHPDVLALAARHGVLIVTDDALIGQLRTAKP
jgi:putative PIN family toxin of toxin-antitoxin system